MKKKLLVSVLSLSMILSACGAGSTPAPAKETAAPAAQTETAAPAETKAEAPAETKAEVPAETETDAPAETETDAPAETETDAPAKTAAAPEYPEDEAALYRALKDWQFEFCSGAGAWDTFLQVNEDGTFSGDYHDSNLGETGEGYDSTIYVSNFTGRLTGAKKTGDTTWEVSFGDLSYSDPAGTEKISEDRTRYVFTEAYGLETGSALEIYLPGTPVEELPEGYMDWIAPMHFSAYHNDRYFTDIPEDLPFCGIYNAEGDYGFYSFLIDYSRNGEYLINRASFPGMKNTAVTFHDDGTYLCEDMDDMGMRLVRNMCVLRPEDLPNSYEDPDAFFSACAELLSDGQTAQDIWYCGGPKDGGFQSEYLLSVNNTPSFFGGWTTGENEDTRSWAARFVQRGEFLFLYGVSQSEYDELMTGEALFCFLSSLTFSGRKDRLSCEASEDAASSVLVLAKRDPEHKGCILADEVLMVGSGDEELIRQYGLDPNDMPNDYSLVEADENYASHKLAPGGAFYVQYPEEEEDSRKLSEEKLLSYLDHHSDCLMQLLLNEAGDVLFAWEVYTP